MILKHLIFVSLLCAAIYTDVNGLYISDTVKTNKDTAFLGRFVFAPNEMSMFEYEIKYPLPDEFSDNDPDSVPAVDNGGPIPGPGTPIGGMPTSVPSNVNVMMEHNPPTKEKPNIPSYMLVIYNDEPGQWPYVRANENVLTCKERQRVATDGGMVTINLNANTNPAMCKKLVDVDGKSWVYCRGLRSWKGYDKPRWWFATLQNCGSHPEPGIDANVNITMTNGQGGAFDMLKHFSADKTWLLPTNVTALVVLSGMLGVAAIFCKILANLRLLHVTFKLYCASLVFQWLAECFLVSGQVDFMTDGVDDAPNRTIFGYVLSWIGVVIFVLTVILVGKGYTVTRGRISTAGCIKLTVYTVFYCMSYAAVYLYMKVLSDPRDTMYIYDSTAGYCLIVLRFVGAFWLAYSVACTIKQSPSERRFYFLYSILFGGWFVAEPILIGITNVFFDPHNRAQAVNAAYWAMTLAGYVFWLGLFVPCDKNHNFPYTIRTWQIGFYDGDSSDQANKYKADVSDDFIGVFVNPDDGKPGAPIAPKVNNFFPVAVNAIPNNKDMTAKMTSPIKTPNYSLFLASNAASLPKTNNDKTKPKPKKPRNTPVGKMIEMKTDYSIFQADGFVTATLVVPDVKPGEGKPSQGNSNIETSIQMEG